MMATAGGAAYPPLTTVAAPYVCDGTVETQSRNYSYKPGQQGVARNIFCIEPDGSRRDITLRTIGAASIYYMLIFLVVALVLWGLVRLVKPRRAAAPQAADSMKRYWTDRLRTDADIVRRTGDGAGPRNVEERLKRLQSLRDRDQISEEEYQAKRAEIISGL